MSEAIGIILGLCLAFGFFYILVMMDNWPHWKRIGVSVLLFAACTFVIWWSFFFKPLQSLTEIQDHSGFRGEPHEKEWHPKKGYK